VKEPARRAHHPHIVVEDASCEFCAVPTKRLHHREFPEIRSECGSVSEGALHLARQLTNYRQGAQSAWHREAIEAAIADVAEFVTALSRAEWDAEAACRCAPRLDAPHATHTNH
jgi:hypothetical protein